MTRFRQWFDGVMHGLLAVPLVFVTASIGLALAMLQLDSRLVKGRLPTSLETTVEGARPILTALAGGLLTSVTLLFSLTLVAVQLASSQFSPRTVRDWTGNRIQQTAIGLVLGTFVYSLLILRATKSFNEGDEARSVVPNLSVLLAVILGLLSIIAMLRAVDHLTSSLRIGSVARSITDQTRDIVVSRSDATRADDLPHARAGISEQLDWRIPNDAVPVTDPVGGWLQQLDQAVALSALAEGATLYVTNAIGSFVMPNAPVAWIAPPPEDESTMSAVQRAFALGPERTMQEDAGFGIMQLVDIALRALSPGVNDPNTANDIIVNLTAIMLDVWAQPSGMTDATDGNKRLVRRELDHADYLEASFGPIRRYGAGDPDVVITMLDALATLRSEVRRRDLPGPIAPIDATFQSVLDEFGRHDHAPIDRTRVAEHAASLERRQDSPK